MVARQAEIERICARYELEPDEFQTAEVKAEAIIRATEGGTS